MWDVEASLACLYVGFFFSHFEKPSFPKRGRTTAAIQAPGPLAPVLSPSFGGTHPKANSSLAKSFPFAGWGLPTNWEPSWLPLKCIRGKSCRQESMWILPPSSHLFKIMFIPSVNGWMRKRRRPTWAGPLESRKLMMGEGKGLAQGHLAFHFATLWRLALCVYSKLVKFIFKKIITPGKSIQIQNSMCLINYVPVLLWIGWTDLCPWTSYLTSLSLLAHGDTRWIMRDRSAQSWPTLSSASCSPIFSYWEKPKLAVCLWEALLVLPFSIWSPAFLQHFINQPFSSSCRLNHSSSQGFLIPRTSGFPQLCPLLKHVH